MAKWLASGVDILILDEPTRGVDVNAKQVIHNVVKDYVAKEDSVILLSSRSSGGSRTCRQSSDPSRGSHHWHDPEEGYD